MKEQRSFYSKSNTKPYQKKEWRKTKSQNAENPKEQTLFTAPKKEKKIPYFILDQGRVNDLGFRYLTRFTCSEKTFRQFLKRKIKEYQRLEKSYLENAEVEAQEVEVEIEAQEIEEIESEALDLDEEKQDKINQWIEGAVAKAYLIQALNDDQYALSLLKQLRNQGQSPIQIKQKMQLKGLTPTQIELAYTQLLEIQEEQQEELIDDALYSCLKYAQKKRYSPFVKVDQFELRQKQLSALARRGFSYDIAKKVLDLPIEEAERLISIGRI